MTRYALLIRGVNVGTKNSRSLVIERFLFVLGGRGYSDDAVLERFEPKEIPDGVRS